MTEGSGIQILQESFESMAHEVEGHLLSALKQNLPPSDLAPLAVAAHDAEGGLIAGLIGSTSCGWLLIKILWVAETQRGHGLGRRVMKAAENAARGPRVSWRMARYIKRSSQTVLPEARV